MKISENFNLSEFTKSDTAKRLGINNEIMSERIRNNIKQLVFNVLQPLRDYVEKSVTISSGYRCPKLNAEVGGVASSQHCKGEGADIKIDGLTSYEIASAIIKLNLPYDQLILYPNFVHVSYSSLYNRHLLLYNKSYKGCRDLLC